LETPKIKRQIGIQFEKLVLGLLKAEAENLGKIIVSGIEAGAEYRFVDAIAPHGIWNLPGPCLIEIKINPSVFILKKTLERIRRSNIQSKSILLVINEPQSKVEHISQSLKKYFPDLPLAIIGNDKINELKNKYPDIAFLYDVNIFDKAIESFESRDRKESSLQYLSALQTAFQNDQLVLFLGAGVSLASGMPSWSNLLNRLTNLLVKEHLSVIASAENEDEVIDYFKSEAPDSPLITARILRDSLGDKFPDYVRRALYENYKTTTSSALVKEIGGLCVPERARQGLVAVVNYNFDEILEQELERRSVSYLVVISEDDTPSPNELPIYHPHGFLPFKEKLTSKHRNSLVLSEEAYHSQFIDPYSWTNITQLNLLRNNVCLFVGLSMTDPNLRRLLEISQKKRPGLRHYVILKDHWIPSRKDMNITQKIANVFRGLEEASFAKLGVSVIWVDEYDEIPGILRSIRK